jgi:Mrp family chromosome partitioning ATPase
MEHAEEFRELTDKARYFEEQAAGDNILKATEWLDFLIIDMPPRIGDTDLDTV